MRVTSGGFATLAQQIYQQIPSLAATSKPAAAPASKPAVPAACVAYLRTLRQDERVKGIGAVISQVETPIAVRLLGGLFEVRKGVALASPLEGLCVTPQGVEALIDGRPQGTRSIALFDTFSDFDAFRATVDKAVDSLYEDVRSLHIQYFAPKNALAALLMRVPDEM